MLTDLIIITNINNPSTCINYYISKLKGTKCKPNITNANVAETSFEETSSISEFNSHDKFNQILLYNYINNSFPYAIAISPTEIKSTNTDAKYIVQILDFKYELNIGQTIIFPASWCYPFKEYIIPECEGTVKSLKYIFNQTK